MIVSRIERIRKVLGRAAAFETETDRVIIDRFRIGVRDCACRLCVNCGLRFTWNEL
jgi:hypothetical protein